MSDLAALRDDVEADLKDVTNLVWTTAEVDRALARALREYSVVSPETKIVSHTVSTAGREQDVSAMTGLLKVLQVWPDYDSTDPEYPPPWCDFELYPGSILFLDIEDEPAVGEKIRIWYTIARAIKDLDAATATTVPLEDEELVVVGATAYCALSEAIDNMGVVTVHPDDMSSFQKWGEKRLKEFTDGLEGVRSREVTILDKRVGPWERPDVEDGI